MDFEIIMVILSALSFIFLAAVALYKIYIILTKDDDDDDWPGGSSWA